MRIYQTLLLLLAFSLFSLEIITANNVVVNNLNRVGASRDQVSFNVSWDNSWNVTGIPRNHDAVWIFVKFRECEAGGPWHHALLSTTMSQHSFGPNITYAQPISNLDRFGNPGNHNTGLLVRRNTVGTGNIVFEPITLQIVGSTDGTVMADTAEYDIKVFAIEMVNIVEESFYIGDGLSTYHLFTQGTNPRLPLRISDEGVLALATGQSGYNLTLSASFPKGYAEFYAMKYEITQGQYADFLNTIDPSNALNRGYIFSNYMYNMQQSGSDYSSNYPDRAMTYLSYNDLLAYLDWAALRPMTEMEYEKCARGPLDFAPGEYAWGEATYIEARNVTGAVSGQEVCSDSAANLHFYGADYYCHGGSFGASAYGPMEVGIFARDTTLTREATGAGYYGMMELSGNVREMCVQVNINNSNPNAPSNYSGIWGDGILSALGEANTTTWGGGEYFVMKGGSWADNQDRARISDRSYINYTTSYYNNRYNYLGGRGVR